MSGFLIETNVISEFVKPNPEQNVIRWFQAADFDTLYASVVTVGEIRLGIEAVPMGKRYSEFGQMDRRPYRVAVQARALLGPLLETVYPLVSGKHGRQEKTARQECS